MKQNKDLSAFGIDFKREVYNYHKDLHTNDRGYGGSIHKRVRERFNLTSDQVQEIVKEMKEHDQPAPVPESPVPVQPEAVKDNQEWHRIKDFGSSRILKGERNVCSMYSESEEFAPLMEQAENMYFALKEFVDKTTIYINSPEGHGCTWGISGRIYDEAKAIINRITNQ